MIKASIQTFVVRNPFWQPLFIYLYKIFWLLKTIFRINKYKCNDDILFIVGSGRSGNTLLRKILMEKFSLYIPPETYILGDVISTDILINGFSWKQRVDFLLSRLQFHPEFETFQLNNLNEFSTIAKKWDSCDQSIGKLYLELYRWLGNKKDIKFEVVGDKTPFNTMSLGLIKRVWPNAKYIFLERDPYDVCSSYVKARIYETVREAATRWLTSKVAWSNHKKGLKSQNYIEVTYEYLVSNPEIFLDNVYSKFDFKLRDEKLNIVRDLGDVNLREHHSNVNNPISRDSIAKRQAAAEEENKGKK